MGSPFNTDPAQMPQQRAIFSKFLDNVLNLVKPEGVWIAPDPSPLNAEEVTEAFEIVAQDPRYVRQHLATRTVDGQVVTLLNGICDTQPEPEDWP